MSHQMILKLFMIFFSGLSYKFYFSFKFLYLQLYYYNKNDLNLISLINREVMQSTVSILVLACVVGLGLANSDYRKDALTLHNKYRANHHAPPLVLSERLNKYAQSWAQSMADANLLDHSDGNYGENIYQTSDTGLSDSDAVKEASKLWYDEKSVYSYSNPGFSMDTGHFTQVVWKGSKEFGIGIARTSDSIYVCGNYDPPGNYEGEFEKNVVAP